MAPGHVGEGLFYQNRHMVGIIRIIEVLPMLTFANYLVM